MYGKHCDDYIEEVEVPDCLRWFLFINRLPAHLKALAEQFGCKPKLFANYKSKRVRVIMASRMGDVGLTYDLNSDTGYRIRTFIDELSYFTDIPPSESLGRTAKKPEKVNAEELLPVAYKFYEKMTNANKDIAADFLAQILTDFVNKERGIGRS